MNAFTSYSESELFQKINKGDIEATKNLYERYSPLLYTLIKKILKDQKLSEETLTKVFVTIQKLAGNYVIKSGNSYTWLVTLTKNAAIYELRKKEGRIDKNISPELETEYSLPRLSPLSESFELDTAEQKKRGIETALNKLTDAQQYVLYLAYYEGLTRQEIAKKLKIPYTTVESKIRTSLINLNENFIGKSSLFTVKNEIAELIYPFVLGSIEYEDYLKTYKSFQAAEPFPWKLLGEYQNLVSLLPMILEPEYPRENTREKIFNQIYHSRSSKKENFERISSTSSQFKITEDEDKNSGEIPEPVPPSFEEKINFDEESLQGEEKKKNQDNFEPVIPFKPNAGEDRIRGKKYSGVIITGLIILFIISAVAAYLFYRERVSYYESQVENLNQKIAAMTDEIQNKGEMPGIGNLQNPQTVELVNTSGTEAGSEIILSFDDRKGYLYLENLPVLNSNSAYQLWGKFDDDFISLGVFKKSADPDYYPFILPELTVNAPVEFYLVESNAAGSRKPGSIVYLRGKTE